MNIYYTKFYKLIAQLPFIEILQRKNQHCQKIFSKVVYVYIFICISFLQTIEQKQELCSIFFVQKKFEFDTIARIKEELHKYSFFSYYPCSTPFYYIYIYIMNPLLLFQYHFFNKTSALKYKI